MHKTYGGTLVCLSFWYGDSSLYVIPSVPSIDIGNGMLLLRMETATSLGNI